MKEVGGGGIRGRRIWGPELFRIKRPTFNCIVFSDGMFNQRAGKRGTPPHFSSTLGNALSSESNQKAERAFSAPPAARNLDTVKTHCENSFSRVQEFSLRVLDEKEMCKKNKCRFSMINLWSCELSLRKRRRDCLVKIINCVDVDQGMFKFGDWVSFTPLEKEVLPRTTTCIPYYRLERNSLLVQRSLYNS